MKISREEHRVRMTLRRIGQRNRLSRLHGLSLKPEVHSNARENARRRRQIERGALKLSTADRALGAAFNVLKDKEILP